MNARLGWFGAACLFVAAGALIYAGHPLVAAVLLMGVSYLAGRRSHRRDRLAAVVRLRDERDRAVAEADRIGAELIYRHDQRHLALFGDDSRMRPDLDDRPDWASIDRKPDTTPARDASPSRAATNP